MEIKIVLGEEEKKILTVIADALERGSCCERCVRELSQTWENATREEIKNALDAGLGPVTKAETVPALAPVKEEPVAAPTQEPQAASVADSASAVNTAPSEPLTFEKVQKRVMEISRKNPELKVKVKEAMNKYSATLSGIPKEKYPEFWADLEGIA